MFNVTENRSHLLLSSGIGLLALSLASELAMWILLLMSLAWLLRITLYLKWHKHLPTVRTLNLLSVLCALVLAYTAWQQELLNTMVNLLFMALALKLMLMRRLKDYFQLITAGTFGVGVALIFNHSIVFAILYAAILTVLLLSLAAHVSPSRPLVQQTRLITGLGLKALPIAIALVLLVPQIGPLWSMPGPSSARTGLAEQVTPGDIAELSQSDELAFRATFEGLSPSKTSMYWRAIVMEDFDGETWRIHPRRRMLQESFWLNKQPYQHLPEGKFYQYEILAEPTQQRWLYSLDIGVADRQKAWHRRDFTLISPVPLQSTYQYQVRSFYQQGLAPPLPKFDRYLNRLIPIDGNPQTREWVSKLRQRHPSTKDFIAALQAHFSSGYRYTLSPPLMPIDSVDALIFEHKAGFCSHYASAVGLAMRLAGIPSRMVTGYLGGEFDDSGYISVYQYDAHAWVEYYHQGQWHRLDPTAWVSPVRISQGLAEAVAYEGTFLQAAPFSLARLKNVPLFNYLRMALADIDYQWSRWVLGFDRNRQQDLYQSLMSMFNIDNLVTLTLGVLIIAVLSVALLFHRYWRPKPIAPIDKVYQQALRLLASRGFHRSPWQGPMDFAETVQQKAPDSIGKAFASLSTRYVKASYDPTQTQQQAKHVKTMRTLYRQLKDAQA